jgi:hypothetical protein
MKRRSFAFLLFVVLPLAHVSAAADVIVKHYKGQIKSNSGTLNIDAKWDIEWPEDIPGVPTQVVNAIRTQIGLDAFIYPCTQDPVERGILASAELDRAQLCLFRIAYDKVKTYDESCAKRAFTFMADAKITFVTDGYLGYRLNGYENEGGSGCHSYTVARVISLTTGRPLLESDFIPTNRFPMLLDYIVKQVHAREKLTQTTTPPRPVFDAGCFMIETKGIRWYLPAYSVFGGAAGVQNILVTWDDLEPFFRDPGFLKALRQFDCFRRDIRSVRPSASSSVP